MAGKYVLAAAFLFLILPFAVVYAVFDVIDSMTGKVVPERPDTSGKIFTDVHQLKGLVDEDMYLFLLCREAEGKKNPIKIKNGTVFVGHKGKPSFRGAPETVWLPVEGSCLVKLNESWVRLIVVIHERHYLRKTVSLHHDIHLTYKSKDMPAWIGPSMTETEEKKIVWLPDFNYTIEFEKSRVIAQNEIREIKSFAKSLEKFAEREGLTKAQLAWVFATEVMPTLMDYGDVKSAVADAYNPENDSMEKIWIYNVDSWIKYLLLWRHGVCGDHSFFSTLTLTAMGIDAYDVTYDIDIHRESLYDAHGVTGLLATEEITKTTPEDLRGEKVPLRFEDDGKIYELYVIDTIGGSWSSYHEPDKRLMYIERYYFS